MLFDKKYYTTRFQKEIERRNIKKSRHTFKIKLFLQKAENSLLIAEFHKDIQPTNDQAKKLHWNYWSIIISYYSMLYAAKAAILSKGYEVDSHDAAQIALGHLLIPDSLEKEDLELLNESYKILEEEYVHYFEEAKKESYAARYRASKSYTEKRLDEIFENARDFVAKVGLMLG